MARENNKDRKTAIRNIWILGFTSLFQDMSSEMILPILPLFLAITLHADMVIIGLIEGIAGVVVAFTSFGSGLYSDKINKRKPIIIIGYSLSAFTKPILAIATRWWHVLFVRMSDRFGKGTREAPRDALIADYTDIKKRGFFFGLHRSLDTVGAIIGVLLATYFLAIKFDYRTIFLISVIPGTISIIILFFVKDVVKKIKNKFKFSWKDLGKEYHTFIIISGLFGIANFSYSFFLLRARMALSLVALIPILYLVYNLFYAGTSIPAGKLADKIGAKKIIIISYVIFAFVCLGFANISSGIFLWILFAVYGVFIGFYDTTSKAYISRIVPAHKKGSALGLFQMVFNITILPAGLIGGFLWDKINPATAFYYGAVIAVVAAIILTASKKASKS